jgi:hypothetical protein
VEGGTTRGVLFVIDASSPETLGAATIHLLELLHLQDLRNAQVYRNALLQLVIRKNLEHVPQNHALQAQKYQHS